MLKRFGCDRVEIDGFLPAPLDPSRPCSDPQVTWEMTYDLDRSKEARVAQHCRVGFACPPRRLRTGASGAGPAGHPAGLFRERRKRLERGPRAVDRRKPRRWPTQP